MQINEHIESLKETKMSLANYHLYYCYRRSIANNYPTLRITSYQSSVEESVQAILDAKVKSFTFEGGCTNDCQFISRILACGFGVTPTSWVCDADSETRYHGLSFHVLS